MPNTGTRNPTEAMKLAIKQKPELIYLMLDSLDAKVKIEEVQKAIDKPDPNHKIRICCVYRQPKNRDEALFKGLEAMSKKTGGHMVIIEKSDM